MTHEQFIKIIFNNISPKYTNKFEWLILTLNFTLNTKFIMRTFTFVTNLNIATLQHGL